MRAVSRGDNELVCKFNMAVGDMVSIRGQGMEEMEGKLNGDHPRLILGLCLEDRTN